MNAIPARILACLLILPTFGVQAVTLTDLINGASIVSLDKEFSDWAVDPMSAPIDTDLIDVLALEDDPMNPGLLFNIDPGVLSVMDFDELIFNFSYSVTVTDPTMLINGASMALTGNTITESGSVVGNSVIDTDVALLLVFRDVFSDGSEFEQLTDSVAFDPQSSIGMATELQIIGESGTTELLQFEQRFSQVNVIPIPAAAWLFGSALLALAAVGRRRSEAAR